MYVSRPVSRPGRRDSVYVLEVRNWRQMCSIAQKKLEAGQSAHVAAYSGTPFDFSIKANVKL